MSNVIIAPSILSADFYNLGQDIKIIEEAGIKWLHFDVMDGHFVPNISFGIPVLKCLKNKVSLFNDVHIMVSDPLKWGPIFVKNGADLVTFHYEALDSDEKRYEVIKAIRDAGARVGMSIKPNTDASLIYKFLPYLDLVLVMSVEPGFGGQEFIESALTKIAQLRYMINANKYQTLIEVDGGINSDTAYYAKLNGADVLVAGSYLFGHADIKERIEALRR